MATRNLTNCPCTVAETAAYNVEERAFRQFITDLTHPHRRGVFGYVSHENSSNSEHTTAEGELVLWPTAEVSE